MAGDAKGKRKVFFTVGGRGLKPDVDVRNVSAGKFTKKIRKHKALRTTQVIQQFTEDIVELKGWKDSSK